MGKIRQSYCKAILVFVANCLWRCVLCFNSVSNHCDSKWKHRKWPELECYNKTLLLPVYTFPGKVDLTLKFLLAVSVNMCGRSSCTLNPENIKQILSVSKWENQDSYKPTYNAAPNANLPVMYVCNGEQQLRTMRWGRGKSDIFSLT